MRTSWRLCSACPACTLRTRLDAVAAERWPEPLRLLADLRSGLAPDAIVFCDSLIQYWASRHFPVYAPRAFHLPWTYGTLGGSLPMAIGARSPFLNDRWSPCVVTAR